jgi:hypothetical protein
LYANIRPLQTKRMIKMILFTKSKKKTVGLKIFWLSVLIDVRAICVGPMGGFLVHNTSYITRVIRSIRVS